MSSRKIMVQISDYKTTVEMIELACAMASEMKTSVILVEMVAVQHPGWLGTDFGNLGRTEQTRIEIEIYCAIAEHAGVEVDLQPFQYVTLVDGVVQAADYVDAGIVFAAVPESVIPFWRRYQIWSLRNQLAQGGRELYLFSEDISVVKHTSLVLASADHKQ